MSVGPVKINPLCAMLTAEQSARVWEVGVFILSVKDQQNFLAGGLLVVDRRTEPLKCGVALLPCWLSAWCIQNNVNFSIE